MDYLEQVQKAIAEDNPGLKKKPIVELISENNEYISIMIKTQTLDSFSPPFGWTVGMISIRRKGLDIYIIKIH